eukprot:scaffold125723_cov87-Cyclotella_meneghiniana.AAC.1
MDREILGLGSPYFTAELWTIGQVDASHSSWTVPMPHFKTNSNFNPDHDPKHVVVTVHCVPSSPLGLR